MTDLPPGEALRQLVEQWRHKTENYSAWDDAADVLEAALGALPVLPREDGWQSMETAPKDGTPLLILAADDERFVGCWKRGGWELYGAYARISPARNVAVLTAASERGAGSEVMSEQERAMRRRSIRTQIDAMEFSLNRMYREAERLGDRPAAPSPPEATHRRVEMTEVVNKVTGERRFEDQAPEAPREPLVLVPDLRVEIWQCLNGIENCATFDERRRYLVELERLLELPADWSSESRSPVPDPSAALREKLAELATSWRGIASSAPSDDYGDGQGEAFDACATELDALLAERAK